MDEFNFKEFAKGLPKDVAKTMQEEGFDTYLALRNASEEDIRTLPLKRGHLVAVLASVRELQGPGAMLISGGATTTTPSPLDQLLAQSLRQLPSANSHGDETAAAATLRADLDPSVFLHTNRTGEHALKIIDFISLSDPGEREEHRLADGVSILLPRNKPRLDSVTPAQWISANSRIMATLLDKGQLSSQGVRDYLAYTAKVGEMATRYTWPSVLQYDEQYRANQAIYNFRWGSDCPHLALVALRERLQPPLQHPAGPSTHRKNGGAGTQRGEACLLWNRGHCTYQRCKFDHVCTVCGKSDHGAATHTQTTPSATATTAR